MTQADQILNSHSTSKTRRIIEIDLDPSVASDQRAVDDFAGLPRCLEREIGRGRSAVVYVRREGGGAPIARKLFLGDPLAKLVNIVLSGAPNPYAFNEDAIATAVSRRRILKTLVSFWFGDRLRLPHVLEASWNEDQRAYQIDMEFIRGRAAALHHHVATGNEGELDELVHGIMRPLQGHLREAGFDGLVWQAGLGNPVASSNFLLEPNSSDAEMNTFVWIDLESGVPALFPLNPLTLLSFYLPKSVRHRCALFDDVDVERLRAYLEHDRGRLVSRIGAKACDAMFDEVDRLADHQRRWKNRGRLALSLQYAERRGHITEDEADFYSKHPWRWYWRLSRTALVRSPGAIAKLAARLYRRLVPHSLATLGRMAGRFLFSQRWRTRWASQVIRNRVRSWERRRQLSAEESRHLVTHVRSEEATAYLTDFGIHLAIKAPVKIVEWLIFPTLFAVGMISEMTLLIALVSGGALGRTAYTLGRLIQASFRGRERPWVALAWGLLPVVGNGAYPMQILYTSTERDHDVAKFILIDLFTAVGRKLPIWGGPDTQTEHFFNRMPAWFLSKLSMQNP